MITVKVQYGAQECSSKRTIMGYSPKNLNFVLGFSTL